MPTANCDVCLGSDFVDHPASGRCGRELIVCRNCGYVTVAVPPGFPLRAMGRDPRSDARRHDVIARMLPRGRVLDVGCGEGHFLARLDPSRYEAVGVEPFTDAAAVAQTRLRESGLRGGVLAGGIIPAHLEAESFDMAVLFGTLCRAMSPRALLMETVRVLKNGGQVVIETACLSSFTARLMGPKWAPLGDPGFAHVFSRGCLERLASTCGLMPGVIRTALPLTWPPPGSILFMARKSGATLKEPELSDLGEVAGARKATPLGATR